MPRPNQRGIAVQHSYNDPVDITESGRLRNLSNAQEELIFYATKVSGPCICGMVLFLSVTISLSMTAMGCLYFHDCPVQDNIPIYLIVGGTMYLVYVVGRYTTTTTTKGYFTILSIFLCGWLITVCFRIYMDIFNIRTKL
ncbi:hypothetical protein ILUMI_01500 [Ignelater luminosus]|uniref:Uncharacterized protein n=1 Tax=Ignelater luminosus TaxID=2038154 RepID=A0A8K0DJX1_IGNLU|nr:hypothetical protein ILUMI_01500 [Ignelater luminosus]